MLIFSIIIHNIKVKSHLKFYYWCLAVFCINASYVMIWSYVFNNKYNMHINK